MSGSGEKSEQEHLTYDIRHSVHKTCISSTKRVTRKFLEVLRCSRAKQGQRNVQKMGCTWKVAFLLIRPIIVFSPFSLPSPLSITRFYILFEQTMNIIEASLLALAKSIY